MFDRFNWLGDFHEQLVRNIPYPLQELNKNVMQSIFNGSADEFLELNLDTAQKGILNSSRYFQGLSAALSIVIGKADQSSLCEDEDCEMCLKAREKASKCAQHSSMIIV